MVRGTVVGVGGRSCRSSRRRVIWSLRRIYPVTRKIERHPELSRSEANSEHIGAFAGAQSEPVVLVGHSMGGIAITQAAEDYPDRFRALIYVCALLPGNGESLATWSSADLESMVNPSTTEVFLIRAMQNSCTCGSPDDPETSAALENSRRFTPRFEVSHEQHAASLERSP
jgi:pimeloyl-ACP methyl ester carboxylesterase